MQHFTIGIACPRYKLPAAAFGYAKDHHAKANGAFVVVLEQGTHAAQHDARVGPQSLEVGCVSGVAAHQQDCRHLQKAQTPRMVPYSCASRRYIHMKSELAQADFC